MINIVVEKKNGIKKVIYSNSNFNESFNFIESVALDTLYAFSGYCNNAIVKRPPIKRGHYLMVKGGCYTIYYKDKDGWISYGESKKVVSYEIFTKREDRIMKDVKIPYMGDTLRFREMFEECLDEIKERKVDDVKAETGVNVN